MLLSIGGYAGMAELADAQDLGSCAFGVQVQALLPAPKKREVKPFSLLAFSFALYLPRDSVFTLVRPISLSFIVLYFLLPKRKLV